MTSLSVRSVEPAIDLLSGLAVAGVAAMALARPRAAKPISRSILSAAQRAAMPTRGRVRDLPRAPAELQKLAARYAPAPRRTRQDVAGRASRVINGGAALLAASVFADSSVEHYRGSFENRAMYIPLVAAAMTLAANLYDSAAPRAKNRVVREAVYGSAATIGLVGLGFHAYNILKRPGGLCWSNLFYAAPVGAPAALTLSGMLGGGARLLRDAGPWRRRSTIFGVSLGRALAAVTSIGLAGNVGEVSLLHFRGNFQNPAMYLPVAAPPVASALLAAAAARPSRLLNTVARWWLGLTALLGIGGVGFHAYGVARGMGGWRNWSQNILNGPPLPAPPSFTGLALAGLATLSLLDEEADG